MDQFTQRGVTILALAIVIIGGFYIWKRDLGIPVTTVDTATTTDSAAADTAVASPSGSVAVSGGLKNNVTQQPVAKAGIPAPDFKSPIKCTLAADACDAVRIQQTEIATTLTKNSTDFESWIRLGTLYKMNADYKNAAVMWEYVSDIYPQNITSFANLGDLYVNFLKDYPRAVSAYTQEVKNSPTDLDAYKSLFQIYTATSAADAVKAEGILKQGIAANPKATELRIILARYYKDLGRTADAKAQYAAAIESAQSQGQTSLAADIQKESDTI